MADKGEYGWKLAVAAGVIGISAFLLKLRFRGKRFEENTLLVGKTVIITGANSGIGKATAIELAKREARVILACRDIQKAKTAVADIRRVTKRGSLVIKELDLASLSSIHRFADELKSNEQRIDVLINNAGIFQCPYSKTADGFEMQMGVNHLGHFVLTNLLLDKLKESAPSRIVVVSSGLHKQGKIDFNNLNSEVKYNRAKAYNNSKLANNLFAKELSQRVDGTGVCVYCLHPGIVRTNLGRHRPLPPFLKLLYPLAFILLKSPYDGCQTILYCAVSKELEKKNGNYYGNCEEEEWSQQSLDSETARKLWDVSTQLTHIQVS